MCSRQRRFRESLQRRIDWNGAVRALLDETVAYPALRRFGAVRGKPLARIPERALCVGHDLVESIRSRRPMRELWPGPEADLATPVAGLREPARLRALWSEPARNTEVALHLGIDLLPTTDGMWVLEYNYDAARRRPRRALYGRDDPIFVGAVRAAAESGRTRVVALARRWRDEEIEEFRRIGEKSGVHVVNASQPLHQPGAKNTLATLPDPLESNTLYVSFSGLRTPITQMIHDKWLSHEWSVEEARLDRERGLTPMPTRLEPTLWPDDSGPGWPNAVVKLAKMDEGRALRMGRFASVEEMKQALGVGRRVWPPPACLPSWWSRFDTFLFGGDRVLYQPFVAPPVLPDGRIVCSLRLHLLLTPAQSRYLSSHAIVSRRPVPRSFGTGLLEGANPLVGSFSAGAVEYRRIDRGELANLYPEWQGRVETAAGVLGRRVLRAVERRFMIRPPGDGLGSRG